MNAVNNALVDLRYMIPLEILNIGFIESSQIINQAISLDDKILSQVVRPRVLKDCNLVGGIEINLPLDKCGIIQLSYTEYVIQVPKTLTNNKSIISVLSLSASISSTMNGFAHFNTQPTEQYGARMMDNLSNLQLVQTSRLELIGENTILVQDPNILFYSGFLRCTIANNTNLENISPRSYLEFSELVYLAVKSYIYNRCIVRLNQGYIYGGHELSIIGDIIAEYKDAEEMYKSHLKLVWKKVAFINNDDSMSRLIKSMIGNNI